VAVRRQLAWLTKQVRFYCEELERAGKYQLYLWPPHCLLGSDGHALAGVVHAARLFHAFARGAQSWVEVKGGNPLTENYSVLRPEVLARFDGAPLAQRNTGFVKTLLGADAVVIAGQAASHCVKSTIDDLLSEIVAVDPALARKVYLLTDCMSAVTVPDGRGGFAVDFTPPPPTRSSASPTPACTWCARPIRWRGLAWPRLSRPPFPQENSMSKHDDDQRPKGTATKLLADRAKQQARCRPRRPPPST
jgi:nicotinamidase-related amidase